MGRNSLRIGLRVDVDTFRGTRRGVPALCDLLGKHNILSSFFFSVGPDNMGRHLWRLIRPAFLLKMLRTKASSLYGWDILIRGTLWPGPVIGRRLAGIIRSVSDAGHEVGLHAWDHHRWQAKVERMDADAIFHCLNRGVALLTEILGRAPTCSAAPAWRCNELVLIQKGRFPFLYNSDCRGEEVFYPMVGGKALNQPQIPVTLPTFDEAIGREGVSEANYNDFILSLLRPGRLNVLTIHAEVEGIACLGMFERFLVKARSIGAELVPLKDLLPGTRKIRQSSMAPGEIPGREGWVACQEAEGLKGES